VPNADFSEGTTGWDSDSDGANQQLFVQTVFDEAASSNITVLTLMADVQDFGFGAPPTLDDYLSQAPPTVANAPYSVSLQVSYVTTGSSSTTCTAQLAFADIVVQQASLSGVNSGWVTLSGTGFGAGTQTLFEVELTCNNVVGDDQISFSIYKPVVAAA
jgi:hypothetical protein